MHRPPPKADVAELEQGRHPAQRRLVFEELLAHHLSLKRLRARLQEQKAPPLAPGARRAALLGALPFALTAAQKRVLDEVRADLGAPTPMQRLVQGDVGSGKTVVAALAALAAVEAGCQVAIMAPTELLAEQHWRNFHHWLRATRAARWRGCRASSSAQPAQLLALIALAGAPSGGRHPCAVSGRSASSRRLGLVIVDEQHRFGVHQRLALREKGRPARRAAPAGHDRHADPAHAGA